MYSRRNYNSACFRESTYINDLKMFAAGNYNKWHVCAGLPRGKEIKPGRSQGDVPSRLQKRCVPAYKTVINNFTVIKRRGANSSPLA